GAHAREPPPYLEERGDARLRASRAAQHGELAGVEVSPDQIGRGVKSPRPFAVIVEHELGIRSVGRRGRGPHVRSGSGRGGRPPSYRILKNSSSFQFNLSASSKEA